MTGVDSIAQAAGRNNREGLLDWGYTCVFSFPEPLLGEQARRKSATEAVLRAGLPLLSPEAVTLYFDELHSIVGSEGLDNQIFFGGCGSTRRGGCSPGRVFFENPKR